MFELVVTCIEAHIFVTNCSISHIFISIIKLFYFFLLLGQLFTWNLQHSKTRIQHHLYTTFDKIFFFMFHIYPHAAPTCDTNKNERCFIFRLPGQEYFCIGISYRDNFYKHPCRLLCQSCRNRWKMRCIFPRVGYRCQLEGCCVSLYLEESCLASGSDQPSEVSACPQQSFSANLWTPKYGGSSLWQV